MLYMAHSSNWVLLLILLEFLKKILYQSINQKLPSETTLSHPLLNWGSASAF